VLRHFGLWEDFSRVFRMFVHVANVLALLRQLKNIHHLLPVNEVRESSV
jgi:hypothetical protein